jgi:hypothetical protein
LGIFCAFAAPFGYKISALVTFSAPAGRGAVSNSRANKIGINVALLDITAIVFCFCVVMGTYGASRDAGASSNSSFLLKRDSTLEYYYI